jgi:Leucine-rich repeat (LRR) protein
MTTVLIASLLTTAVVVPGAIVSADPGDPAMFADAALALCIADAAGTTPAALTQGQVAAVTELSCISDGITDLTGLEIATGLTSLNLDGNPLADLGPIGDLIGLTALGLDSTGIDSLAGLEGLSSLTTLAVSKNPQLTSLTGVATAGLGLVEMINSPITSLAPLADATQLWGLQADGTAITSLEPLEGSTELVGLSAAGSTVSDLGDLSGLTSLQFVDLSYRSSWCCTAHSPTFTDLDAFSGSPALFNLNVEGIESLVDIDGLAGATTLEVLDIRDTGVSSIAALSGATALRSLWMSGSAVPSFAGLGALPALRTAIAQDMDVPFSLEGIEGSTTVQSVAARGSQVRDVSPLTGLTTLVTLDLSGNEILDASPLTAVVPGLAGYSLADQVRPIDSVARCAVVTFPPATNWNGTPLTVEEQPGLLEAVVGGHRFLTAGEQVVTYAGGTNGFAPTLSVTVTSADAMPCDGWSEYDTAPTLAATGTVGVGRTLSATFTGAWSPTPDSIGLQWYRVASNGTRTAIPGATAATYTPRAADRGHAFVVEATAQRSEHLPDVVTSPATARLLSTPPSVTVTGKLAIGSRLTARLTGNWTPAPTLTYRWQRVAPNGTATLIPGATTTTYTPTAADRGRVLRVTVTATRSGYASETIASTTTRRFFAKAPTPTIIGTMKSGTFARVKPGKWSPSATISVRWYTNRKPIPGATGTTLNITEQFRGKRITVQVTAQRPGTVTESRTSAPTKPVT